MGTILVADSWRCSCGLWRPMTGSYGCRDCDDPRPDPSDLHCRSCGVSEADCTVAGDAMGYRCCRACDHHTGSCGNGCTSCGECLCHHPER